MAKLIVPESLPEALALLESHLLTPYAGGTDLRVRHRGWGDTLRQFPGDYLYIGKLPELRNINISQEEITIGSAVTFGELTRHPGISERIKAVFLQLAAEGVRNIATLGGNICNASPAGDSLPMLYALDARLELANLGGKRMIPIKDFIIGPGKTLRTSQEILLGIHFPLPRQEFWLYRKLGQRSSNAIAKLSVFIACNKDGDHLKDLSIALGAVGPTVIRPTELENEIAQTPVKDFPAYLDRWRQTLQRSLSPIDDLRSTKEYRLEACQNIIQNFLYFLSQQP